VGTAKTWVHRARTSVIQILQQREVLATHQNRHTRVSDKSQVEMNDACSAKGSRK